MVKEEQLTNIALIIGGVYVLSKLAPNFFQDIAKTVTTTGLETVKAIIWEAPKEFTQSIVEPLFTEYKTEMYWFEKSQAVAQQEEINKTVTGVSWIITGSQDWGLGKEYGWVRSDNVKRNSFIQDYSFYKNLGYPEFESYEDAKNWAISVGL